jgi:hypothetical protein
MIKQTKYAKAKRSNELKKYVADYKASNPCVDCGRQDIRGLHFDHIRSKKLFDVSEGIKSGIPLIKLQKEIGKCVVRCAYCHAVRTSKKNNDYLNKYVKKHKLKY